MTITKSWESANACKEKHNKNSRIAKNLNAQFKEKGDKINEVKSKLEKESSEKCRHLSNTNWKDWVRTNEAMCKE